MPKTSLDPTIEQQFKKLFIECLQGKNVLIDFGNIRLQAGVGESSATVRVSSSVHDYEVFVTQIGATATGYSYSIEKLPDYFKIHSSNSADTSIISYLIIGS